MNWKMTFVALCITAGSFSCNNKTETTGKNVQSAEPVLLDASLVCREIRGLDDAIPLAEVAVKIGDKLIAADSISVCAEITPSDYPNYEIPANAISACGAWWAGAGDYFYLVNEGNDVVLMAGWQEEEQEDEGFHFKKMSTFSRMKP